MTSKPKKNKGRPGHVSQTSGPRLGGVSRVSGTSRRASSERRKDESQKSSPRTGGARPTNAARPIGPARAAGVRRGRGPVERTAEDERASNDSPARGESARSDEKRPRFEDARTRDASKNEPKREPARASRTTVRRATERARISETAPSLVALPRRRTTETVTTEPKAPSSPPVPDESELDPRSEDFEELPVDSTSEDIGMLGIGSRVYPPDLDFELFEESEEAGLPPAEDPSVEARIREIEARLAGLMSTSEAPTEPRLVATPKPSHEHEAVDATRELLESDYYRKNWGRGGLRPAEGTVDDFGLDPTYEERLRPFLEFLFKHYFRVEVEGIDNIPARGRAVVVSNHSGALPFDGAMLREAARLHHPVGRDLRWLAEDFSFYLPFIGVTMNRIGAVRACQENAERLLETEHVVAVFPEGAEGLKKLYKERYRLQRFGRGGYIRLCLKTRSPIVPCAVIGAEETNPILYRFDNLSKLLGLDYLPVTPTFPFLGPLGLLPAPTKWRILFGEPISVAEYGRSAAEDHVLVGRLSERVRSSIQGLLDTGLRRRKSIWF